MNMRNNHWLCIGVLFFWMVFSHIRIAQLQSSLQSSRDSALERQAGIIRVLEIHTNSIGTLATLLGGGDGEE